MAEPAYTVASDSETSGEDKPSSAYTEIAIGIDIGTSQCSVAAWNGSEVQLLKNTRDQTVMRSYVTFKDEIPSGGISDHVALSEYEIFSGSAIFNMKRLVGRMDTDPVVHASKNLPFLVQTLDIGARPFIAALVKNVWRSTTPEEVLAVFLVELRAMAEVQLRRAIRNIVLTIPVSFSRFQVTRIERACAMAGLHVLRLMPEPTAVALLYAQQQQQIAHENMGSGSEKIALIFNMGAGYCDVAVTATAGGVSQIKALSGSVIGGEDILQNVMHHFLPNFDSLFSSHGINEIKSIALLRIAIQEAIHRLTTQTSVPIEVNLSNGSKISRTLDRAEFEEVNKEVFKKCEELVLECLSDAKVEVEDITDVILVGGCSSIPKIRDLVLGMCKRMDAYSGMDPLQAAVCGAALEGAVASGISDPLGSLDLLTIQVTPQSLGIKADGNSFVPIIHRNATVPARKELIFTTTQDNQTEALIVVYEGEGKRVEDNHLLGYFKLVGIPPAPKGTPEISVCMDIDASNVLRVYAGVILPTSQHPATPFMEVRMPTVDGGHGWCAEALLKMYGSSLDLNTIQKKILH
ncbi:heat shock 70 kDa protein 8-like [Telopea speciosissima]|uniref:heat shock 70 kDa protein 8-like n=1 Tax=Telopea speciosissima TaxID=54955 RepID=UPI001CC5D133|nr:heat shock 70 kDa protein 8-like [Telopea speciosissima]XP_043722922.1 heat shock 70 kDa protein 8-like [Telopea speciosissima]